MREVDDNWLPVRAALRQDGLYLALRQVRADELRDAFMQETVARVAAAEKADGSFEDRHHGIIA